jgi:hypothetical protein
VTVRKASPLNRPVVVLEQSALISWLRLLRVSVDRYLKYRPYYYHTLLFLKWQSLLSVGITLIFFEIFRKITGFSCYFISRYFLKYQEPVIYFLIFCGIKGFKRL